MLLRQRRRLLVLLAVPFLAAVLMTACGEEEDVGETPEASPPTAAEPVPGVTDTEIVIGTLLPLSNHPAAAYAPIGNGMKAYFEYINDTEGGVNGRQLRLVIGDNQYTPAVASEAARKLVEQGVPDMFILTGVTQWTEPVVKTRFGGLVDYVTEGKILGLYIAENYPDAKLGLILQNDDFGFEGEEGVLEGIKDSNATVASRQTFESVETDLTRQVQAAKQAGADVLVVYAVPTQAANAIKVAREVLSWDVPIILTGVSATDITIALAGAQNAEGVVSVVFGHQIYETEQPGIQKHIEMMQTYEPDVAPSNLTLVGYTWAELLVEVLKRTGPDLTRDSFVETAESIRDYVGSMSLVPVSMSPTDHRPIEVEVYAKVTNGIWQSFGEPVSFESTPE